MWGEEHGDCGKEQADEFLLFKMSTQVIFLISLIMKIDLLRIEEI